MTAVNREELIRYLADRQTDPAGDIVVILTPAYRDLVVDSLRQCSKGTEGLAASAAEGEKEDWREDPSADERWNLGCDFAMMQLCCVLGVDPNEIMWDAATETVEGDVRSVIGNILREKTMLKARQIVERHIRDYGMVPHPDRLKEAIALALSHSRPHREGQR